MLSKNQIKEIQSLQLKKFRDAQHLFIAEGIKTVLELIAHKPELIKEVFATRDFFETNRGTLAKLQIKCSEINEAELTKISLQHTPNHALAVCYYFRQQNTTFNFDTHFSMYLDDVRDPGNFGTMLRLADWFGISTVFCSPSSCDFYNPKVIQASMGAFLRVALVYAELEELKRDRTIGVIYGAVLNGESIYKKKVQNGLLVIGNEANGIRETTMQHIDQKITIPAHASNGTESLNAAVAASILVSEFFRQLN